MAQRSGLVALLFLTIVRVHAETTVPPVYGGNPYANPENIPNAVAPYVHFKSPNPDMHFTAGQPVRVLADGLDPDAWTVDNTGTPVVELFVDGVSQGSTSEVSPDLRDWNEFVLTSLTPGTHTLDLVGHYKAGNTNHGPIIQIIVDAPPPHANAIVLTQDLVLSGSQNLNWSDATITGNGHVVKSAAGWTGSVTIQNCLVTGLGGLVANGIDVATQNGSVTINDSIFEWTGAVNVAMSGSGSLLVKRNQFRANCQIDLRPVYIPDHAPIFHANGNPTGTKVFQGNNVGYGFVMFENMNGLLIGGNSDAESNILIGPRCGFNLFRCQNCTVRGNYSTHNYRGEWSQGFNFIFLESTGLLVEHNVIRGGSWPVQSMSGEFRYNLVVDSGHEWVRSIGDNSLFHHNIFIQTTGDGNINTGIWMYQDGHNVSIFNNTFDCGGTLMNWSTSVVMVSAGSQMASVRNNAFTNAFPSYTPTTAITFVDSINGGIGYVDYNAFWNPNTANGTRYSSGTVTGHTVGQAGFGAHDVQANVKFAKALALPYPTKEGDVWNRVTGLSQVLASYRANYTPLAGSPLIDAGDPADGAGTDIGAIGAGIANASDQFGTFGQVNGNFPPFCRLTAPADNATFATGSTIALSAEAIDYDGTVSKVEFLSGTTVLGASTVAPYAFSWPSVAEGIYTLTVRATDNKGATSVSQPIHLSVGNRAPVIRSGAFANPNPATVGDAVAFTVAADDPDADALSYAWAFGDAGTNSGAQTSHTYIVAGTYQATVTIQDGHGGNTSSGVNVTVLAKLSGGGDPGSGGGSGNGGGGNSGGAGGPGTTTSTKPMTVSAFAASLHFDAAGKDVCSFSGTLMGLPAGFNPAGQTVLLNIGGVTASFTLNAKGSAKSAAGTFQLKLKTTRDAVSKKSVFKGGNAPFKAVLKSGSFTSAWSDEGVTPSTSVKSKPLTLVALLTLNGVGYTAEIKATLTSAAGKSGRVRSRL